MRYGCLKSKFDSRDYKLKPCGAINLPEEFELSFVPFAKNQKQVNSCVAHVAAEIEEYFEHKQCNKDVKLSPGFIYGTRYTYKGEGMYCTDALKTLRDKGICIQQKFPYNREVPEIITLLSNSKVTLKDTEHCKITKYFRLRSNEEIKQALYTYGPVMIAIDWYDNNYIENGILQQGYGDGGGHCLYVYGWDTKGFKFLNSWGESWGDKGKCILPYSYHIEEAWGITDNNIETENVTIYVPPRNKFIDIFYKIINLIVNIFKRTL